MTERIRVTKAIPHEERIALYADPAFVRFDGPGLYGIKVIDDVEYYYVPQRKGKDNE